MKNTRPVGWRRDTFPTSVVPRSGIPPVRAAAAPVRLGLKLRCFSAKTRSTWTATARGASPLLLSPPLPRRGRGRSRASFHRQRGTLGGGRCHLVPLTRAGARGSGGRARGVAVPASRDRHRRLGGTDAAPEASPRLDRRAGARRDRARHAVFLSITGNDAFAVQRTRETRLKTDN